MRTFKQAPRSVRFWNIFVVVIYGFSYFFLQFPLFLALSGIMSIVGIIILGHDDFKNHFWPLGTPLFIIIIFVMFICKIFANIFDWIYDKTIRKFNNWLDGTNKKTLVPFEDNEP